MDMRNFGRELRDYRNRYKLTLEDVADILHKHRQTIYRWEIGENMPRGQDLQAALDMMSGPPHRKDATPVTDAMLERMNVIYARLPLHLQSRAHAVMEELAADYEKATSSPEPESKGEPKQ